MWQFRRSQLDAMQAQMHAETPDIVLQRLLDEGVQARKDAESGDIAIADSRGFETRIAFDDSGLIESLRKPSGAAYQFAYNPAGQLTQVTHPGGETFRYQRNEVGQVKQLELIGQGEYQFLYDDRRSLAGIRYPDGREEQLALDLTDTIQSWTDRNGASNHLVYTPAYEKRTDALGRTQTFHLDNSGALSHTEFADGSREEYSFDDDENLLRVRTRGGGEMLCEVDDEESSLTLRWADDRYTKWTFDDEGNLLAAENSVVSTARGYDDAGRLTEEDNGLGPVQWQYDKDGRLTAIATPQGDEIAYEYDEDGRLNAILDWEGRRISLRYGSSYTLNRIEFPNQVFETWKTQSAPLRVETSLRNRAERQLSGFALECDFLDRVRRFSDRWGEEPSERLQRELEYDAAYHLTAEVDSESGRRLATYEYDLKGNMTTDCGMPILVGLMDEPVQREGSAIRYDGEGNITFFRGENGPTECDFSADGRLRSVRANRKSFHYEYDALCRRISKTDGVATWSFGWAGEQLLWEEYQANADADPIRRDYLYAPRSTTPIAFREANATYWIQSDHRGAVLAVHNEAGEIVWRGVYDGFGRVSIKVNKIRQPWRLAGHYYDEESGLHYNFARYYSPELKSYLSIDPQWLDPEGTTYSYARNDPWNRYDPLGMLAPLAIAAIGVGVAGLIGGAINAAMAPSGQRLKAFGKGFVVGAGAAAAGAAVAMGIGLPALAGAAAVAGLAAVGAVEGAVGSILEDVMSGRPICWACAAASAGLGAVLGIALPFVGGIFARKLLPKAAPLVNKIKSFFSKGKGPKPLPKHLAQKYDLTPGDPNQPILFGQKGVSPTFGSKGKFKGADIDEIVEKLNTGQLTPDDLPVQYIWVNGEKVVVNNRSLTALTKAGKTPTKTIDMTGKLPPDGPDSLPSVLNRLEEMNGKPSRTMPVRSDPDDWNSPPRETVTIPD